MSKTIKDQELAEYKKLIGAKKYRKEYLKLYQQGKYSTRFSGKKYENSPDKLKQIKEKYKNGVSKDIINNMLDIKE